MSRRLIILGVTGSIGRSAVDVILTHGEAFKVVAVVSLRNREACETTALKLGAKAYCGPDAALRAVEENDADICLVATVGLSGLRPTLAAIEKGMDIALATKEVLVMAGGLVMRRAAEKGVRVLPVDSEHSAIFQCLQGGSRAEVDRLILTASGGPFLNGPEDLSSVTIADALHHPNWKMGPKVSVDSATMMNKGLEVVEAHWLFGMDIGKIDVVIHPESVVHSLVTFVDGSTLAQLCVPDMRVAIQYALTWPKRLPSVRQALDLAKMGTLTFRTPDSVRFPALRVVREACAAGGAALAVMAAADEVAVSRFLEGRIAFGEIVPFVSRCLERAPDFDVDTPEAVEEVAAWVHSNERLAFA